MDVEVINHGSIVTLEPISASAREWFDANVALESWQIMHGQIAVEPRMAFDIVDALVEEGFTVQG